MKRRLEMNKLIKTIIISQMATFLTISTVQAESFWDKTVNAVSDTASKVSDTVSDAIDTDPIEKEKERKVINDNAQKALSRLLRESNEAKEMYEKSAGYAVFDSREFAFLIKTGFGHGVTVNKNTNERTYMKMASGGLNIGGGIKYMQVIFMFPTEVTLNKFIHDGWTAESDASAVGGDESGDIGMTLADGTKIYQLVDTGVMLKASISGTKYWKDSDLN
jgi:lipid-binding SYLF domain-containing protein